MYKIEKILTTDYNERTDDSYLLRKGCIGKIYHIEVGHVMIFAYQKDNQGNDKVGYLRTSAVKYYKEIDDGVIVHTLNSIYYLSKVRIDNNY